VSTLSGIKFGPCAVMTVTLNSGEIIDVRTSTSLAGCSTDVTPVLLGHLRNDIATLADTKALVLTGSVQGETWIGSASWRDYESAWCVIFDEGHGAFREGDSFRLASGLVLRAAPAFRWLENDETSLLPLRQGDDLCLDETGQVIGVDAWNGR